MRLYPLAITALCLLSTPGLADEKGEAMVTKWLAAVPKMHPIAIQTTTTYTYGKWRAVFKDKSARGEPTGSFSSHGLSWVDEEFPRDLFHDPLRFNLNPLPEGPDYLDVFTVTNPSQYLGKQVVDGVTYDVVQVNELINHPWSRIVESLRISHGGTLAVHWYFDAAGTLRRISIEGPARAPDAAAIAGIFLNGPEVDALTGPAPRAERLAVTLIVDVLRTPRSLPERARLPNSSRTVSVSTPIDVQGCAFSPDSRQMAIALSGQLELFDTSTGRRQNTIAGSAAARLLSYSGDGKLLAFVNAGGISVVNTVTGTRVHSITLDNRYPTAMGVSPDGMRVVTASGGNEVEVWNVVRGVVERRLAHSTPVIAALFKSDGKRLVTETINSELVIWDTQTWSIVKRTRIHGFPGGPIAISRDGNRVAAATNENVVMLWTVSADRPIQALKGAAGAISNLAFSPDGRTLSAIDRDERDDVPTWIPGVLMWNIETGQVTADYAAWPSQPYNDPQLRGIVSPDGRLAAFLEWPNEVGAIKLISLPK